MMKPMNPPKIDVQNSDMATLMNQMAQGNLQIPRFQREFVWSPAKTRSLLDSMYKEFPIGTFFFWQTSDKYSHLFRELADLNIPKPKSGFPVSFILDGQQRLTSLYVTLYGLKVSGRDYGRICIDLQTAQEYEENQDEKFEKSIFVTRAPDNRRYISVQDMVGDKNLEIVTDLPEQWRSTFIKAGNRFKTYPFSVVWVQDQPLGEVVEIFQRINQGGKRLSRYDLVCANVWKPGFDFRNEVAAINNKLKQQGFGAIDGTIFSQTFALILKGKCTTAAELELVTEEIQAAWDKVIQSLLLAIDFAEGSLGVKRSDFLPYRGILVVLAYYFYYAPTSAISAKQRNVLWSWFWQVSLSERYSSTSPTRMAEDAVQFKRSIEGEEIKFNYPSRVTPRAIRRITMTSTSSALRNAVLCMLALRNPKNFKDNTPVNLSHSFFSSLTKAERHHIFPIAFLTKKGFRARAVHLSPNFCYIPANLNKEISGKTPSEYMAAYQAENPEFMKAADSHLIPIDKDSPIWKDDYEAFLDARSALIAQALNQLTETGPDITKLPTEQDRQSEMIEIMELRIRDLIDERLNATLGDEYWKLAIPGDVSAKTRKRIKGHLKKHPYEDWSQFPPGRSRLDFCDVSDYQKIILSNWATFESVFGHKQTFSQHMESFSVLRNSLAHHRTINDVEKMTGEAAILWLRQALDTYADNSSSE